MLEKEKTEMKALLITIPSNIEWSEYQKEIDAVKDGKMEMNFKCSHFPQEVTVGDRCYVCYRGNILGWMRISSFREKSFNCATTGTPWSGKFIGRSGKFHKINPVPYKGFQGFRYIDDLNFIQLDK